VNNLHFINDEDEEWMRVALSQAKLASAQGEVPVGAVAVKDGNIIGQGFNRKEQSNDPTSHAELVALRKAARSLNNWRLTGVTLYSTLEPCPMCAGAMIQGRISRLVYGARDIRFGADGSVIRVLSEPLFNHSVIVKSGVLEHESAELMQAFFRQLRSGL